MTQTITTNDVLLYIYNELDDIRAKAVEDEMLMNDKLAELYLNLTDNKRMINTNLCSPGQHVLDKIKAYAANTKQKFADI